MLFIHLSVKKRCDITNKQRLYSTANFDWEKAFPNVDVKKQVMLFSESFLIIIEGRKCNI